MRYNEVSTNLKLRRLLPSRYACHLPPGGRLFVSSIITQIGRENKFSAEIFVSVISPLRMQREGFALLYLLFSCLRKVSTALPLWRGTVTLWKSYGAKILLYKKRAVMKRLQKKESVS